MSNEVIVAGFGCRKKYEGQKNFDKYYISKIRKEVFVKTGTDETGDEIGVKKYKVVEDKKDISKYINSQASEVGLEAYIRRLTLAGEVMPTVTITDNVADYTKCPSSLAEAQTLGDKTQALYKSLDRRLTKGKSLEEFLQSLNEKTVTEYLESISKKPVKQEKEGE